MSTEIPSPQVNIQEQHHYICLKQLIESFSESTLIDAKLIALRKLRYYTLTSDRIRSAACLQRLPNLLLDEFVNLEITDNNELTNEFIQVLASFALVPSTSNQSPTISQWEQACKKSIEALHINTDYFGIACAQFIINLIIRITSGMERNMLNSDNIDIETAGELIKKGSNLSRKGPPLLNADSLACFLTLLNNQDGPTFENVCHLMFRLFTVAFDDHQEGDKSGYDRCTSIFFVERKAMREVFTGLVCRTTIIKQLSTFLQTEYNVNCMVMSLHLLSLIFSLIPRNEIRDYLLHKLSTSCKIDIREYLQSERTHESPKEIMRRIRHLNRERFITNQTLTDTTLLDHLFILTKSVQKHIIQLLASMALCICMQRSKFIAPVREIRIIRLLVPCLCRLACLTYTEGDSEDVYNIPTMAMVLLLKVVPRHHRLEKVACFCDDLPKSLVDYLHCPRKRLESETDAESQEWSEVGGRCIFRSAVPYDMQQWSRFFLCFDPCDTSLLYAMPAIPMKQPWLDDRSFRSIVFQCIAALCSRLNQARNRFLRDDRLLGLTIDAINSSFPALKMSALICYHVLTRSICHVVRHLANDAMCQKVFSTLTKTLMEAAVSSNCGLDHIYTLHPSTNPTPLDDCDPSGGCPLYLKAEDVPYDDNDVSSDESEKERITSAVPVGSDMCFILIKITLSIIANLSAGMVPGCPRTFVETAENLESRERTLPSLTQPLFLDDPSIEIITKLLQHVNSFIVRSAAWVLINITYICDDHTIPLILQNINAAAVERMLNSNNCDVWEKAFGLMQNIIAYHDSRDNEKLKELVQLSIMAVEKRLLTIEEVDDKKQEITICLLSSIASSQYASLITNEIITLSSRHINVRQSQQSRLIVRCFNKMITCIDPSVWKRRMCVETNAFNIIFASAHSGFSTDYMIEAADFIQRCNAIV